MKKLVILLLLLGSLFGAQKIYKGDISNDELQKMLHNGVAIVDIRTPPEWRHLGIVPGSKMITFFDERGNYNINDFISKLNANGIKKGDDIIIICRSGNRSVHASNMITSRGFESVYNVKRGIKGWIRNGKKVQRNFY